MFHFVIGNAAEDGVFHLLLLLIDAAWGRSGGLGVCIVIVGGQSLLLSHLGGCGLGSLHGWGL